jgi:hypothetical protein
MDSYVWQFNTTHNGFLGNCKSYVGWGQCEPNWFALTSPSVVATITKTTTMCGVEMQCTRIYIVVTYEIRVFFEGAQKEVFSSIF